jgi:protein-tyrosine phosphatase
MDARTRRGQGSRPPFAVVETGAGAIGIAPCPGRGGSLAQDLDAIAAWPAALVVTLVEEAELATVGVIHLGREVERRGLAWLHAPIADFGVPDAAFEARWAAAGRRVRQALRDGGRVLLHCRAGLGRSGMIAARTLVELGWTAEDAIAAVRHARPGAIETPEQEAAVRSARASMD